MRSTSTRTDPGIFENAFFLRGFCVYGALTTAPESGFQNNAFSVSGFTAGFVWTEGRFV